MLNSLNEVLTVSPNQRNRAAQAQETFGLLSYKDNVHGNPVVAANNSVVRRHARMRDEWWYVAPELLTKNSTNKAELAKKPFLVYNNPASVKPPSEFFCPEYLLLKPEEKSAHMRGNINLAVRTVFWLIQDRVGTWPSLVDSAELKKLLKTEIGELSETDHTKGNRESALKRALGRDRNIEWYRDPEAEQIWDVVSEVADLAFCSLQYWLAYDSCDIAQCEATVREVVYQFDRAVDPIVTNDNLIGMVHDLKNGDQPLPNHSWPEMILGLCHLLTKRMGVDLWEAITLKCLANERHYPQSLQLVEPDRLRRMDEARTTAWVFAKKTRKNFSEEKRFIPPMSDWLGGPTVLDQIYDSPYLVTDWVCLHTMLEQFGNSGGMERVVFDSSGVEENKAYYPDLGPVFS